MCGIPKRLLQARLPEEEVAAWGEPFQCVARKRLHFIVSDVHEQPVDEDDVVAARWLVLLAKAAPQK